MRLLAVRVENLLSFEQFVLDVAPDLTVIVGPNGAGKTNLAQCLRLICAAVDRSAYSQDAYHELVRFAEGRRAGSNLVEPIEVRAAVDLSEDWERKFLVRFVQVVTAGALLGNVANQDTSKIEQWIDQEITEAALEPLFHGEIVASHRGLVTDPWDVSFVFSQSDVRYRWVLMSRSQSDVITYETQGESSGRVVSLAERLGVAAPTTDPPVEPFAFDSLLPNADIATSTKADFNLASLRCTQELAAFAEVDLSQRPGQTFNLGGVLSGILRQGLIVAVAPRRPIRFEYDVAELQTRPSIADPSSLPLHLYALQTGDQRSRDQYANVQQVFTVLTGKTLSMLAEHRDQGGKHRVHLLPVVSHGGRDLPIEFAGAGRSEALALAAMLAESAGRTIVLDEPAAHLHTSMQRHLLGLLRSSPGQVVITTHSPFLVPATSEEDLKRIVRFDLHQDATVPRRLGGARFPESWLKELSNSADVRALLFAAAVIVVEGDTELGALPIWFDQAAKAMGRETPEDVNIIFVSAGGDKGFRTYAGILHAFGIPWAIVCDGAALSPTSGRQHVLRQLKAAGVNLDSSGELPGTFDLMKRRAGNNGVFTLATGWERPVESFEAFLDETFPGERARAAREVGQSKPRIGARVARDNPCPEAVAELFEAIVSRFALTG